jgi:hypothetical protein
LTRIDAAPALLLVLEPASIIFATEMDARDFVGSAAMPVAGMVSPINTIVWAFRIFCVIALIDAEHSFHSTNKAAYGSADHSADWTGDATTLVKAMSSTAGNSLSL